MTLSTRIIICEPTNPKDLFMFCLDLLGRDFEGTPAWEHTNVGEGRGYSNAHFNSTCGQGLPAWLWVHYATDAPLQWTNPKDAAEHGDELHWFNDHLLSIDFDTAYGYRASTGAGCSDFHAWLITQVAEYLAAKNITKWVWQNEFTGEWFNPDDDVLDLGNPEIGALPEKAKES